MLDGYAGPETADCIGQELLWALQTLISKKKKAWKSLRLAGTVLWDTSHSVKDHRGTLATFITSYRREL